MNLLRHRVPAALAGGAFGGVAGLGVGDDLIYWQQALAAGVGMLAAGIVAAALPGAARAAVVIAVLLLVVAALLRKPVLYG